LQVNAKVLMLSDIPSQPNLWHTQPTGRTTTASFLV